MTIAHKIVGNAMQMIVCQVAEGQTIYAEAGKFLWKTVNVGVETRISHPDAPPAASGTSALLGMAAMISGAACTKMSISLVAPEVVCCVTSRRRAR